MDPRRLLTFREVARRRSFSRAAEALSLTQSAVSQQVAALERQLGTRLLDRRPGGLRLTPSGEQLLGHAGAIADRLALADAQLAERVAGERRELRLGAFPSALATIVPDAVSALLASVPDLQVSVTEDRTDALARSVRDGSLHLAVAFQDAHAPRREHPGTRRHDLFTEPMVAALPPHHRLRRRDPIALRDLADDPWTVPSRDGLIMRACARAGFTPRIAYLSSDPLSIRAIIAAGLAVTITPRMLAGHLQGIHIATVRGQPARRDVYALLPDTGARATDEQLVAALARPGSLRGSRCATIRAHTSPGPPGAANQEAVMTSKADFTDEEWTRLKRAPFVAGMAISLADPGGPIEAVKETSATLKTVVGAAQEGGRGELVDAVASEAAQDVRERKSPLKGFRPAKGANAGVEILDELREVNRIVSEKATPDEAAGMRELLMDAAQEAANAAKEGGFMGFRAERVSEGEQRMLDSLREALGASSA